MLENEIAMAHGIADTLADVTKREVIYEMILKRVKTRIPEYVQGQQRLLRWAEGVYYRELSEIGFGDLAQDALLEGYNLAVAKFINK